MDSTTVVVNMKPITHILSIAVNRNLLAFKQICNKKWNQLLRKMVSSVVITTTCDDDIHAVSTVI